MLDHMFSMEKHLIKYEDTVWFLKVINNDFQVGSYERIISDSLTWHNKRFLLHKLLGFCSEDIDIEDSISEGNGLPLFIPQVR